MSAVQAPITLTRVQLARTYAKNPLAFPVGTEGQDAFGCQYRLEKWDVQDSIAPTKQRPVGYNSADKSEVTADFSDVVGGKPEGILCATPTVAKPYVWIMTGGNVGASAAGFTSNFLTDATIEAGDRVAWIDDFQIGSNDCTVRSVVNNSFDLGYSLAADAAQALTPANMVIEITPRQSLPISSTHVYAFDDFAGSVATTAAGFLGDSGTDSQLDVAGGVRRMVTGATANDQRGIGAIGEVILPGAGKRGFVRARVRITEGATNDAGFTLALANMAADLIADTTGALATGWIGGAAYKIKDNMFWRAVASIAASQDTDTGADIAQFVSATWYDVLLRWTNNGTNMVFEVSINGAAAVSRSRAAATYATELRPSIIVKNIPGTTTEALDVDSYEWCANR